MHSAVKASLVANTGRPDSDEVRLRRCTRAKLLSVHSILDLDRKLLVTTKATRPFSLLSPHARTRLNTHPGQGTTCPPTPPFPQRQACQELLLHPPFGTRIHHPEYAKRLTSGMIGVVSLSFDEGMPWTDSACCSLPPRRQRQLVARHQPSRRRHFQDMKQSRRTEVSTQAYICHNLYALNSSILRLSQWELSGKLSGKVGKSGNWESGKMT
jgi:hypothetical protein